MIRASSMQTASVRWRRRARYAGGSSAPTARCSYSQKPPEPTTSSASPRSPPSATALAAGLFSPALMEGADHATRAHPACGLLTAADLRRQACSRVRCTFQRMRTVRVRAAGERRNGKTGADSSKAGAAPATVIEITRITSATAPEPTVREGDPPESLLQLESPETGLTRLP